MGAPAGHPFFGNQYTNGGYESGTFRYINEIFEASVDDSPKLPCDGIAEVTSKIGAKLKPKSLVPEILKTERFSKNTLIIAGISVAVAVTGYFAYKYISKKSKAKNDELHSIELSNVGTCTDCGQPLCGSTYIPENNVIGQAPYIICKECGVQNFAWFPDENDLSNKYLENINK